MRWRSIKRAVATIGRTEVNRAREFRLGGYMATESLTMPLEGEWGCAPVHYGHGLSRRARRRWT